METQWHNLNCLEITKNIQQLLYILIMMKCMPVLSCQITASSLSRKKKIFCSHFWLRFSLGDHNRHDSYRNAYKSYKLFFMTICDDPGKAKVKDDHKNTLNLDKNFVAYLLAV